MLASDRPTDRDNRLTRDTTRIHIDQAHSHGAGQLIVPVRRLAPSPLRSAGSSATPATGAVSSVCGRGGRVAPGLNRPTEAHLHRPPDVRGQAMFTNHHNERVAHWTNNALK